MKKSTFNTSTNLEIRDKVIRYVAENKESWHDIEREADFDGLNISYTWLARLAKGDYADPGVSRMEYLLKKYVE